VRTRTLLAPLTVLLLLAGACGATEDDPALPGEEPGDQPDETAGSDPLLGDEVRAAIDDLVATGVDRSEVLVVTAELVTWPDGALGCPEPDRMYTQALVDGYRIELESDGELTAYHGAVGESPFRCEDPQPPIG